MNVRAVIAITRLVVLTAALFVPSGSCVTRKGRPHRPVQVVKIVEERSFSWRDAGIGATGAGLGVSVVAGVGLLLTRTRRL
jgi:hypothetical protein